jgi:uncharacterized protein YndB with AHSA1/START domain/predicted enzyme related to lactoylglutathione lyase
MSTNIAKSPATLRVTRLIKAPRERVFAAWTTPQDIMKWFGPETCRVLSAKVDLSVGGEYHIRVKSEQMASKPELNCPSGELELRGVYREVKRPSRLVYTWNWKGAEAVEFGETLVTVDFLERNGFTEVQITHDRLPTAEQRENHSHGWNGCLDKLEKQMAEHSESETACGQVGTFCWNELLASETSGAAKFYTQLFGWKTADFPGGMNYTLFKQGEDRVAGLMQRPHENAPPHWLAYVQVENVDATVKRITSLGGKMIIPGMDIPTVGRIAVFQDPQGAALGVFQPARA